MRWLLAGALVVAGALSAVPAAGALTALSLSHPDSSRWVYWAVGASFAALSIVLFSLAGVVLLASKQKP